MVASVYDLRSFYGTRRGRVIHPVVQAAILRMWPDANGLRVMGAGYAVPYLAPYLDGAERVFAVMPAQFGVHAWAPHERNMACIASENELPIETESVDRIIVCHGIEHAEHSDQSVAEYWRVLKSTGKILIVVPNRLGFWARAEWSPFGHGTPFSLSQTTQILRDNLFVVDRVDRALYLPALRSSVLLRTFLPFEKYGRYVLGGMGGLLLVEASKQLYSGLAVHNTARVRGVGRRILVPSAGASARG